MTTFDEPRILTPDEVRGLAPNGTAERPEIDHDIVRYEPALDLGLVFQHPAYSRPLRAPRLAKLRREWNTRAAAVLEVAEQADGRFALLDGGHRWTVARERGIGTLRALIHSGLSLAEEARLWNYFNDSLLPSALDKFRAAVVAEDPDALEILAAVRANGLDVPTYCGHGDGHVQAVGALRACHKFYGAAGLHDILATIRAAWGTDEHGYQNFILGGVGAFLARYGAVVDRVRLRRRMAEVGPEGLERRATSIRAAFSEPPSTCFGRALVVIYNKDLRSNKLTEWTARVYSERALKALAGSAAKGAVTKRARGLDQSEISRRAWEARRARLAAQAEREGP